MSNYILTTDGELMHYGVPGMKWGKRIVRGHAGPGNYISRKRQLAGDKRDLNTLNAGGHLSKGLTKKRQAAYDARDKAALEKRIAKNEAKMENNLKRKLSEYATKKISEVNKDLSEKRKKRIHDALFPPRPKQKPDVVIGFPKRPKQEPDVVVSRPRRNKNSGNI